MSGSEDRTERVLSVQAKKEFDFNSINIKSIFTRYNDALRQKAKDVGFEKTHVL